MLYDGLTNSSEQYGLVGNVVTGTCQFINFAMYLNWPTKRFVMGLTSYPYPSVMVLFKILECYLNGMFKGETILGTGFWQIEDGMHHELSAVTRKTIKK